jgi:hypothetical protein
MSIKQKFESIDQSQLSENQKEILGKIKTATKDFTITDQKALDKVDSALDNIITKLKATNPQAIKGESKKQEPKAKKEVVKKEPKSETKKPKKAKKEAGGKRTIFSIAKEIRKADESWEDAKARAKKVMETEKEDTTKKMKSETDKLLAFIKRRKELEGLSGTSVKKDSKIEALPKGRRISKKGWKNQYGESEGGRVYYENRDNRTDRLAPSFDDKIYLADGGYAGGGYVVIAKSEKGGGFVMSKPTTKAKAEKLKSLLPKIDGETNEVMTIGKATKLSGLVGKQYLKYADGGAIIGTPETPLARGLDMHYTGLVGETGAMSSGEMFMDGGSTGLPAGAEQQFVNYYLGEGASAGIFEQGGSLVDGYLTDPNFGDFQAGIYAEGGSLGNHGLKQGDQIIKTMSGGVQKVKTRTGDIVYVNLANGYRGAEPPLPFDKGGRTTERRFVNHGQDYEVRYAKDKPKRRGYGYADGGTIIGNPETPLGRDLGISYTGLVGETGAMSSGEMFADGGTIDAFQMRTVRGVDNKPTEVLTDEQKVQFAKGGEIVKGQEVGLKFDSEYHKDNLDVFVVEEIKNGNYRLRGKKNGNRYSVPKERIIVYSYATGGGVGKSFRKKRNEYLEKLGQKEGDVWDKIGANSGADIRNSDKLLKAYAEGVQEMLQKEEVGKGSFDQEDYDFYTDENWHLFNEFLVWNGYYDPEITKTEKAWREDRFKDPKYRNYVSNPKIISLSGGSKSKSTNYVAKDKISTITIVKDGKEIVLSSKDVLNGVNLYDGGGKLKNDHTYFAKRYIKEVVMEDGDKLKPSNGYWVKKSALDGFKNKVSLAKKPKFKVDDLVYNKRTKSVGIVRIAEEKGEVKTDADGNVSITELEVYNPLKFKHQSKSKVAPSTQKEIDERGLFKPFSKFEVGGKTTFKEKATAIAKNFEGKKVEPKYQKEYGKVYDKAEAKEVGNKIAGSQKAKYDSKMSGGGTTKRGGAMVLAKQIRKEGESWASALKRANEQMRKK